MPFITILVFINTLVLFILLLNCLNRLSVNKSKIQELSDQVSHLEGMLWKISTILEIKKPNAASAPEAKPKEQAKAASEAKPEEQAKAAPEAKPAGQAPAATAPEKQAAPPPEA